MTPHPSRDDYEPYTFYRKPFVFQLYLHYAPLWVDYVLIGGLAVGIIVAVMVG